ncbi:cytochrome P450 [Streptomyces sp. AJS327]|uniref:cytochrome P450 n=1 Tax=Streptomyces sp. AJS327 TaxID=2545265 RepID=UPI0015DE7917|nr:cytochrome P450 [Streptomyces sp. AJS327]
MTLDPNSPDSVGSASPPPGCPAHGAPRLDAIEGASERAALYERLRGEYGAVAPVRIPGDLPAWLVLGHREVLEVVRTPSKFSRDSRLWTAVRQGQVTPEHPLAPVTAWQPVCSFADGEEHKRLRSAVTQSIGRVDRHGMRRYVNRFTGQLVQQFGTTGRADLVSQFAAQLPMLVMSRLIGLSEQHGPQLVTWVQDVIRGTASAGESNTLIVSLLRELVERKRGTPGQDITSWLILHEEGLADHEVLEHLRFLLISANTTTTNLITSTLVVTFTDRRLRANLAGASMTLTDALDQVLWDSPPMTVVPGRWATGDTTLAGQEIREGDLLLLGLLAGNSDPAVRPDLSVPVHRNRSHLSFSGGPHECPGQDIGRGIAETGIDALLHLLPDLRLAVGEDELEWDDSWLSSHLTHLPVVFTPRRTSGEPVGVSPEPANSVVRQAAMSVPGQSAELPPAAPPSPPPAPSTAPSGAHEPSTAADPRQRGWLRRKNATRTGRWS